MPTATLVVSHNFLAGPYIDRRSESREEVDWRAAAVSDPGTLFLLARGTAHPIGEEHPSVTFVRADDPAVRSAALESWVLLGWYREARCVLVQLGEDVPPPPGTRFEELRPLAALLDGEQAGLLAYARALTYWQRRHRHCGVCGAPCEPQRAGHVMRCGDPTCATESFPRIDPAVIVLVSDGERALLGRQSSWPAGRYSTVAGFVEPGESLEDTIAREVLEETGVVIHDTCYHSSQPWPFPSSLMLGFTASASPDARPRPSEELEDVRWFSRDAIAAGEILLPPPTSISHRLIAQWFDAHGSEPLAAISARSGPWYGRGGGPR